MPKPAHRLAAALVATALALAACTPAHIQTEPTLPAHNATNHELGQPQRPNAPAPTDTATACLDPDHNRAPGGLCLYPAKVIWLSWDALPIDPATLDWTDPDTVAAAYVITLGTWDSAVDASTAYATHRAAIFTAAGRTSPDTTDPDTARGQADYTATADAGGHTTVTIHDVATEGGPSPEPLQPDGTWQRVVTYTRTLATRT